MEQVAKHDIILRFEDEEDSDVPVYLLRVASSDGYAREQDLIDALRLYTREACISAHQSSDPASPPSHEMSESI